MKSWLERVPADPKKGGASVDGTVWKRRDDLAQKQRELDLRDWLAANAHLFGADTPTA